MTIEKEINHTDSNGIRQGLWRTYHYNSSLWYEVSYMNGKAEGLWRWWYKNGQLRYEGHYVNGIKDGEQLLYRYEH